MNGADLSYAELRWDPVGLTKWTVTCCVVTVLFQGLMAIADKYWYRNEDLNREGI